MTTLDLNGNTIGEIQAAYENITKQYQQKLQAVLKREIKEFFDKNSNITAIYWTQFAPYFNDGEPCEFRTNDFYATNCPLDGFDDLYLGSYAMSLKGGDESISVVSRWDYSTRKRASDIDLKAVQDFLEMLDDIDSNVYKDMFGEHVRVTCTRNGFSVEDCSDHD